MAGHGADGGEGVSVAARCCQGGGEGGPETQHTQKFVPDMPDVTNVPPNSDNHEVADILCSDENGLKN